MDLLAGEFKLKEVIILAGGLGTRLRDVVKDVPKPMADINGKPFLHYIFKYLKAQGVLRVILAVSYKKEFIVDYFRDKYLGIEVKYSIENSPLGTGGAIKKALEYITSSECYVINGDTYFTPSLDGIRLLDSSISLSLKYMTNFDRYGSVVINNGYIESFLEKKYFKEGYINAGIYKIKKDIFNGFVLDSRFSFETFLEIHFRELNATGIVFDNTFIDIGIKEDYELCKKLLQNN